MGLLFTVSLPEIKAGERPRRRFMSAFEQKREVPNRAFQYMVVSPESDCPTGPAPTAPSSFTVPYFSTRPLVSLA
jgi:hypothetical protein